MTKEIVIHTVGPIARDGSLGEKQICLTFDDGPHATHTERILDILKAAQWRANFFYLGMQVKSYKDVAKRVAQDGHVVGSHSYSHKQLDQISLDEARADILDGHGAVEDATGMAVPFFRFPYGASTHELVEFITEESLSSFKWNMDGLDWKIKNEDELLKHILEEVEREKKGILLLHDIHEVTVKVLPKLLGELNARGFESVVFVP